MRYIQCTHCGKRYETSEKIEASVGKFTTCSSCHEKFLIVIQEEEKVLEKETVTGGWDPALTMPVEHDDHLVPDLDLPEDVEDETSAEDTLKALKAAKKKKLLIYGGIALCIGILAIIFFMMMDEQQSTRQDAKQPLKEAKKVAQSAQAHDKSSATCRQAAAQQWMIDDHAMHGTYTGDEFVRLLKRSQQQSSEVRKHCKQHNVIAMIIDAATAKEKPQWFSTEIEVIQKSRKY